MSLLLLAVISKALLASSSIKNSCTKHTLSHLHITEHGYLLIGCQIPQTVFMICTIKTVHTGDRFSNFAASIMSQICYRPSRVTAAIAYVGGYSL